MIFTPVKTFNVTSASSLAPALDAAALAGDRRQEEGGDGERKREATNNSWWATAEQRGAGECDKCLYEDTEQSYVKWL